MDGQKNSLIPVLVEVIIGVVLIVLIFISLNYFRIISLSSVTHKLSFLPIQSSTSSVNSKNNSNQSPLQSQTIKAVVESNSPNTFKNEGKEMQYDHVASSSALLSKDFSINLELSVNNNANSSGVIFNNGVKYSDNAYRGIRIFRNKGQDNWMLEYVANGKSALSFLSKSVENTEFKYFVIRVSNNGQDLVVMSPDSPAREIKLMTPIYNNGSMRINASVQVAPSSKLTIYSLYYQI
ncbi:MAG TPA: hypothetical protein VG917_01280 [Patescibacteria group bacterium]|nr:hypothetical protein [Patescibacteria group bacterium]